jgi:uncharacterized protein YggU (UPF0235/DUF167 family)
VLAHAGGKRNAILGVRAGALRVAVTEPPERGKANEAIQTLLAQSLGLKPSRISLISGTTSRKKRFLLEDVDPRHLAAKLMTLIPKSNSPAISGDE